MVNKYFQKTKGKLQKEDRENIQNLPREEKEKRRKRHETDIKIFPKKKKKKSVSISDRTKNLSEEEK